MEYYLLEDYENMELNNNSVVYLLGLGDFLFYNLMVLFILPPLSSIETKICIGIGCIIFIQIDYMLTIWMDLFKNQLNSKPALPLPIVAFSLYAILLNIFVEDLNSNLC
jgi:hypothetical protein